MFSLFKPLMSVMVAGTLASSVSVAGESTQGRPTIVLVHGAFAESSSWNQVIAELDAKRYTTIAVANPLRGVKSDADYVARVVRSIEGAVVLVGHSYGGFIISTAAKESPNVKALVYVAAFAPENGETAAQLSRQFAGSTLGAALAAPVALADGGKDLYIRQDKLPAQFAADIPLQDAKLLAATQRPITEAALNGGAGPPAWKATPSWFIYGDQDRNIPAAAMEFMAKRAQARSSVVIHGASHVVMVSHPREVADLIEAAAQ